MAAAEVIHVNVAEMIDLALGTPEVGYVDFNMLQSVLHVLAQQQHVLNKGVELRGLPPPISRLSTQAHCITVTEYKLDTQAKSEPVEVKPKDVTQTQDTMLVVERTRKGEADEKTGKPHEVRFGKVDDGPQHRLSVVTTTEFQKLEMDVNKIRSQVFIGGMNNDELLEHVRKNPGSKMITDMWTSLNVSTRIEALEEGLSKLSSIVQALAEETSGGAGRHGRDGTGAGGGGGWEGGAGGGWEGGAGGWEGGIYAGGAAQAAHELEMMKAQLYKLTRTVCEIAGIDEDDLGGSGSGPGSANAVSTRELRMQLDAMEKRMRKCCDKIAKIDGVVSDQLTSFQDQLIGLGDDISSVNDSLTSGNWSPDLAKDVQGLTDLFRLVKELQKEVKSVRKVAESLAQEKDERGFNLNMLIEQVEVLKMIKMDRDDMVEAMAEKADVQLLARKVSHDQFESACDDLSRGLDNALSKLNTQESLWQQALDDIQREIECKLDKLELAPVKQFFTDKLAKLQESLRQMAELRREAEAAGTKKKFLRDVNCISCDAQAMMAMAEASTVPAPRAMPPAQLSIKPYLTYELDQIRKQQAAAQPQRNMHDWENIDSQSKQKPLIKARSTTGKHLCTRYCGGSHTVTTPAQRVARAGHFLKEWGPDVMPLSPTKESKNVKGETTSGIELKTTFIKAPGECHCLEGLEEEGGARG